MKRATNSLRFRLISISLIIVCVPLIVFGVLAYRFVCSSYVSAQQEAGGLVLNQAKNKVEDRMSYAQMTADLLRSNMQLQTILRDSTSSEYSRASQLDNMAALKKLLVNYELLGNISMAKIVYEYDCEYASIDKATTLDREAFLSIAEASGIALVNRHLTGFHWICADLTSAGMANGEAYVALACMMRDIQRYDRMLGYIVVFQEKTAYAAAMVEALAQDSTCVFCLTDGSGNTIASTTAEANLEALRKKKNMLCLSSPIQEGTWKLELLMPLDAFTKKVNILTGYIVLITLLLTGAALSVADALYRKSIVQRIESMVVTMDHASNTDDMQVRIPVTGFDELSRIERHFNMLMEKMSAARQREMEMVQADKAQQIRLLNAQINPHFLYNALNAIYWAAQDEDYSIVQKMITSLAHFYKTGFHLQSETGSIQNEIEHVQEYIALINLSKKRHYRMKVEMDESIRDMPVPHFILQPIVENCVIHGFGSRENGNIDIRAQRIGDSIRIDIEDDGVGFPEKDLPNFSDSGSKFGLESIRRHFLLCYGNRASISVGNAKTHKGCIVKLVFPI